MKVICDDELVIDCDDFKAIDTGVLVIGGEEDTEAIGYVPNERLDYVLPDDVVELEHERLGLPAPEIRTTDELESRLGKFVEEIEELRTSLDQQVEDLIDHEAPFEEENVERQDRLYEQRRTIDRALQQVRKRAQQFQQLSLAEFSSEGAAEGAETAGEETAESTPPSEASEADVASLRAEMDERLSGIEAQLQALAGAEAPAGESATGDVESATSATEDVESAAEPAEHEIEGISGLGPTYRDRLEAAGIETLGGLAESDPGDVAEAANVTESKAQDWIDRAAEMVREAQAST